MASEVADIVSQLQELVKNIPKDEASRRQLFEASRSLNLALESLGDSIQRICYIPLQLTVARIGTDLGLFELLAKDADKSASTNELAEKTGADPLLLKRLLRYLASVNMIREVGENRFAASNITKTLVIPGLKAGIKHCFTSLMPVFTKLPSYLAEIKYQNPTELRKSAFQPGHNTDLTPYEWLMVHPAEFIDTMQWMSAQREGEKIWTDVFPFEQELGHNLTAETPLLVDVGGSIGHQCVAFKAKYPHLPGRVILQDLPPVIANAIPAEGVEATVHDFFTEQPIKGARAYYMRNVMHDYPNDKCKEILRLIMDAMDENSVILIDEMILPNEGVHWQQAQLDLMVMSTVSAIERSEKEWYALLDDAGLKIRGVHRYTETLHDSIIVAVPN